MPSVSLAFFVICLRKNYVIINELAHVKDSLLFAMYCEHESNSQAKLMEN
jgi:hypothetical protein